MVGRPLLVAYRTIHFVLKFNDFIWLLLHLIACKTSELMRVLYQSIILMRHFWTKSQFSCWGASLDTAFVLWPTFCFLFCLLQIVCNLGCIAFLFARCAPCCGSRIPKTWILRTFGIWRESGSTQLFKKNVSSTHLTCVAFTRRYISHIKKNPL